MRQRVGRKVKQIIFSLLGKKPAPVHFPLPPQQQLAEAVRVYQRARLVTKKNAKGEHEALSITQERQRGAFAKLQLARRNLRRLQEKARIKTP